MKTKILTLILTGILMFLATDCKKEDQAITSESGIIGKAPNVFGTDKPATDVSQNGVTLNGDVNANGLLTTVIFEYAYERSISTLADIQWQTVEADQSPLLGNTITHVSARLIRLKRGTYMFRVKAKNSSGTEYGNVCEVDILGTGDAFPTVTTLAATDLSSHTATLNATVNPHGLLTGVSFEWGTTTNYGSGVLVNWYSPDSVFNVSLTWYYFEDGITIHYRVFAGNMEQVVYGKDMEFIIQFPTVTTLEATNVEPATATLNGIVNANNLSTIVTFEYGTSTAYGQEAPAEQNPVTGNINTNVSATLTGLCGGTNYNFRIKAVNSSGTTYGENKIFNSASLPILTTTPVYGITSTTAISGGNISDDGGAPITDRGVSWGLCNPPGCHVRIPPSTHDGAGSGSFTSYIAGLKPATKYYVQAYAVNGKGVSRGNVVSFTTAP